MVAGLLLAGVLLRVLLNSRFSTVRFVSIRRSRSGDRLVRRLVMARRAVLHI